MSACFRAVFFNYLLILVMAVVVFVMFLVVVVARNVREGQALMSIEQIPDTLPPASDRPRPQDPPSDRSGPSGPATLSLAPRQVDLPAPSQRLVYIRSTEVRSTC